MSSKEEMFDLESEDLLTKLFDTWQTPQPLTPSGPNGPGGQLVAEPGRFEKPVTRADIHLRNQKSVPKKTQQANNWTTTLWKDWARSRNDLPETAAEPGFPIPEDVGELDDTMLDYWGQRFVMEIRRKDGKDYPPSTLVQVVSGLQRYLRNDCYKPYVNFLKSDDPLFAGLRRTLDTKMKELHAQGVGSKTQSSDPVTKEDEAKLWENGVFSTHTATGLSNAVFYYNGKLFGFRGFQEHISCQADQLEICSDVENHRRYIKFTPRLRKNSQGGLKNRRVNYDPIIHYEQPDRKISVLDVYEKYLSLIPRVGQLYRKPLGGTDETGTPRFSCGCITQYGIKHMLKRFFEEAGIDTSGRKITNHSARVTLCTTLYNDNFADKAVTSRSKHRSSAVKSYQREQFSMLNSISSALEPPIQTAKTSSATVQSTGSSDVIETSTSETPIKTENHNIKCQTPNAERECEDSSDDTLTISVPTCVKTLVIVKKTGKKMMIDI